MPTMPEWLRRLKNSAAMQAPITLALGSLLVAGLALAADQPVAAQYMPPNPGMCGSGFVYSARMCVPRGGGGMAYEPPNPGACAMGYLYSARMCVPRNGVAINAYHPPMPGVCANDYHYSAGMCVPRR